MCNTKLAAGAVAKIVGSIRENTKKQYSVYILKFVQFYGNNNLDDVSHIDLINFLDTMYTNGVGYSCINTARSAISLFCDLLFAKKL